MLSRGNLHPYQERAVDFITHNPAALCILGLGLGKTVSTLTAVSDLFDQFMVGRVLIIAPLRVCQNVWRQEANAWSHTKHLSIAMALGRQVERIAAVESGKQITVINRENVTWLTQYQATKKSWPWDMVVIDESSSFKAPSAKRFKALKRVRPKIRRSVLLTATPTPNSLLEIWPQVWLLDQGKALGKTFSGFRTAYFDADFMGFKFEPKAGAPEKIQAAIRPMTLAMRTEDYLTLPAKVERIHRIELPEKAMAYYKEMERHLIASLEGVEINAVNAAALVGKLQQAANGATYDEEKLVRHIHDAKLDYLEELIEAAAAPVIVAYTYRHDFARLKARFPRAVDVKSHAAVELWNAKQIPILLCHPASAGHGLNLQKGGSTLIWFGQTWSGELDEQMAGRIYRQGQTERVMIHRLVAAGTVDEIIIAALAGKSKGQRGLVDAVKTLLTRVKN